MPATNKCAYSGCNNSSRKSAELSFHRLPNDDNNRKEWLIRAGRDEWLQLEPRKLENQRICSAHFQQNDFVNFDRKSGKRRLNYLAVPTAIKSADDSFRDTSETINSTVLQPSQSAPTSVPQALDSFGALDRDVNSQKKSIQISRRKHLRLLHKVSMLTEKLKKSRQVIRNLTRKKVPPLTIPEVIKGAANFVDKNRLLIIGMQLNHIKQSEWDKAEKQFALDLFRTSPKAYVHLRDHQGIALPCISVIREWIHDVEQRVDCE